ncbi:hypothetical protein QW180_22590 [Vibrio sinaloensis]|nr:hypothetical protein [Vibrio sinaloensis]
MNHNKTGFGVVVRQKNGNEMDQKQVKLDSVAKDLQQILAGVYSPAQLSALIPKLVKAVGTHAPIEDKKSSGLIRMTSC